MGRWLGTIGLALILLHLLLSWRFVDQTDQLILNGLFWSAIVTLLWRRREKLDLNSDRFSSFLGLLLLVLLLVKSLSLFWVEANFVRLWPGLAALSLGLLASGFKLYQYRREAVLLSLLMLPSGWLTELVQPWIGHSLQVLTAQLATFLLHYAGFSVTRQGASILLSQTAVVVEYRCTGISILIGLLQIALLWIVFFQPHQRQQRWALLAAGAIALGCSGFRVALMATVAAQPAQFEYWHGVVGAQIFSTISILLFGGVCHWLLPLIQPPIAQEPA